MIPKKLMNTGKYEGMFNYYTESVLTLISGVKMPSLTIL